ncbi:BTAD domain-containing putative transcriptional regulator [Streptomyces sp. ID05-04B]|uniref:AfsR/SARP family transcriptional regulator n=1 Tax=Streptomyces sp. ID05-04B TaxID=3028661 RepID=UPI0029C1FB70|nr:BTAD domain-containing putative transcriptional regulator [Streptomyces sp. ID05-04B]MDX5566101.1 BTAD domain-containing putative transcriptional regulator [Streptomyces sp. ID05-04B]
MSVRVSAGGEESSTLEFAVLGPLRVTGGERAIGPGSPQQQAVLAQLLMRAGLGVPMWDLVTGVWGEEPPDGAVANLRTYAWRLRRLLEPDPSAPRILVSVGDGYRLDVPGCSVDALEAAELAERSAAARDAGRLAEAAALVAAALGLWRGEPLAKVPGPFADQQRERWGELRTALLEEQYDLELAQGRYRAVIPDLTALAAEHPGRERLHGLLMRALHATGRRTEALALFQRVRHTLIEEQGMEPGRELAAVHRQILEEVPERTPRATPAPVPRTTPATARATSPATRTPSAAVLPEPRPAAGTGRPATAAVTAVAAGPDDGPPPTPAPGTAPGGGRGSAFPRTAPAQLLRSVPDFVGRTAEIATLHALLTAPDRRSLPLAAVSGMGGIGKTSLVLHVAHLVRGHYPDGQLYADLRGMDPDPEDPAIVLGAFLDGLGCPLHLLPDTVGARARLLRTVLDGRRVLLVLDNAADAAQVRHLVPGAPGCAVLVTSRTQLPSLEGAVQLGLGRLLPEDAVTLVGRIIGAGRLDAERADVHALVGACGQLPLATRIVSARLAARPGWPVAALTARLTDEARRVNEMRVGDLAVEAAFDLSYHQLSSEQARAFRLIAVATAADVGPQAAGAILQSAEAETEEALEALVSASMMESPAPGRYRIHDLLRAFGRARARAHDAAEADRAYENLLGHLLATACQAFAQLVPGDSVVGSLVSLGAEAAPFPDPQAARAWAAEHFEAAVLAVQSCADHAEAEPHRRLLPAATDLLVALSPFVGDLRHEQLAPAALRVAEAARRRGDQRSFGRAQWLSCSFALRAGRLAAARTHAGLAVRACRAAEDVVILRQALNDLGLIAVTLGESAEAITHYEEALALARRLGHRSGEIATLLNCALAHVRLGATGVALDTAREVLEAVAELDDESAAAYALYVKGVAMGAAGHHEDALRALTEALEACDRAGDDGREVHVRYRLADTLRMLRRFPAAESMARQAVAMARRRGDERAEAQALLVCGRVLADRADPDGAQVYLEQSLHIFEGMGLPEQQDVADLLEELGRTA